MLGIIKAFFNIDSNSGTTLAARFSAHYRIDSVNVGTVVLPKITPDSEGHVIMLTLSGGSQGRPWTLQEDAGDKWAIPPGETQEQWGVNTLDTIMLVPDVERNEWYGFLMAPHNNSAPST